MSSSSGGAAPADLKPHRKWRVWQIILAYLILAAIASVSIWLVDREAMRVQVEQEHNQIVPAQ
jgi:hypothetical protein